MLRSLCNLNWGLYRQLIEQLSLLLLLQLLILVFLSFADDLSGYRINGRPEQQIFLGQLVSLALPKVL